MTAQKINQKLKEMGITVESKFVPLSQSRNRKPEYKVQDLSINWLVSVNFNNHTVLSTDYSQGIGHLPKSVFQPSYNSSRMSIGTFNTIRSLVETGSCFYEYKKITLTPPSPADIMYCLTSDADVLNYSSFEDWASCFGYGTDSRKAEKIYQECLKQALQLRAIGQSNLDTLQVLFQDY